MLIQDYLLNSAERYPDSPVLLYDKKTITYSRLAMAAWSVADWLCSMHLDRGFRAAILTEDPFEYFAAYFAAIMAGGLALGLNSQTSRRSLSYYLNDSKASVLFTNGKYIKILKQTIKDVSGLGHICISGKNVPEHLHEASCEDFSGLLERQVDSGRFQLPWRSSCDIAQIIYTSGTTGNPKGVMLSHSSLDANTRSIIEYLQICHDDRVMAVLPFFYSYGNSIMLTHVAAGASLSVNQNFMYPNMILEQMKEHEVTGLSGVPSTFSILLHRSALNNYSFPVLRYITQAGAPMSPSVAFELQKKFPGVKIFIMYGQTEASARLSYLPPEDLERKPGSIGKPIPGVELQLLDANGSPVLQGKTGEIVARGENIMSGYWRRPEETAKVLRQEGLWTGDLAYKDSDGYLYIVSRKSDIIKSGAHRIGPQEIEDVIMEHGTVSEVAVIGIPDEILGEKIKACVVLKKGQKCTVKELRKHCRAILPAYKVPHTIEFLPDLPKTSTGKIKRSALRDRQEESISCLSLSKAINS
ncbi:MAG: AMP-dependent synthetase [Thermodesulfatator sp.]|nr:MAG: AMP-dependent synthetase [Thermodesulfatator sp.]